MIDESQLLGSELARRYALDNSAEWQRLLRHFEWRQAFAFIVILVPDKYGAEICRLSLEQFLAPSHKKLLTLRYDQPDELRRLTEQLMGLEPPADTGAIWVEAVIPEAVKEYESWREAWRIAVAVLNRFRNPLMRRFNVPLLFVGAPWLQVILREVAPDLWSVATLVVRVEPEVTVEREPVFIDPFRPDLIEPQSDENAPDPDFALQKAASLRRQAGQELQLASLLHRAGKGFIARYEWKRSEEVLSEAVELRRRFAPDSDDLAEAIYDLSEPLNWQRRYTEAKNNLEEALRIYQQIGSVQGKANCIRRLGDIALWELDYVTAKERYEHALSLYRKIGNVNGEANCTRRLGDIALRTSDHVTAKARYDQALSLYRKIGFEYGVAQCLRRLGDTAFITSDLVTAQELYEQSLAIYRRMGSMWGEAQCIRSMGDIALRRSDQAEAQRNFDAALALFERMEEPLWIGLIHLRLARLAENESERERQIQATRAAWKRINRPDLIRKLEEEFGNAKTNS